MPSIMVYNTQSHLETGSEEKYIKSSAKQHLNWENNDLK